MRLLAIAALTLATPASAAEGPWREALMSGSTRLVLYSMSQSPPAGSEQFIGQALTRIGATPKPVPPRLSGYVRPLVSWDNNFNNRIPGKSFMLGNLELTVDPDSRAASGLVLGVEAGAQTVWRTGFGSTLTLGGWATLETLASKDMVRRGAGVSLCHAGYQGNWTWLDLCARLRLSDLPLDPTERETRLSAGLTHVFTAQNSAHEASITLASTKSTGAARPSLAFGLTSAIPDIGTTRLQVEFAKEIQGQLGRTFSFQAGLTRELFGKPMDFDIGYSRNTGGMFFGNPRRDTRTTISIARPINDNIRASVSYFRTRSTADVFSDKGISINFGLKSWSF